jgi:hypothetical protein
VLTPRGQRSARPRPKPEPKLASPKPATRPQNPSRLTRGSTNRRLAPAAAGWVAVLADKSTLGPAGLFHNEVPPERAARCVSSTPSTGGAGKPPKPLGRRFCPTVPPAFGSGTRWRGLRPTAARLPRR